MNDYPPSVQPLLAAIVDGFSRLLGDNLVGIYLHGSVAMSCFNPRLSDVDFLVVIERPLSHAQKVAIVELTLQLAPSAPPKGLEYSVVLQEHTQNFSHPCPYDFHYGLEWHAAYQRGDFPADGDQRDPDLAAHFTMIKRYGHVLIGQPIADVFGDIPTADFWAALWYDLEDILDDIHHNPLYGVLNLCRALAFWQNGWVLSKATGIHFAERVLDQRFAPLFQHAREIYLGDRPNADWDRAMLDDFVAYAAAQFDDSSQRTTLDP